MLKNADLSNTVVFQGRVIKPVKNPTIDQKAQEELDYATKRLAKTGYVYKNKPNADWWGQYDAEKNRIEINSSEPYDPIIAAHEYGHATNLHYPFKKFMNNINKSKVDNNEVYSDIWELRYKAGFKPGQVIDMKTINSLRNKDRYEGNHERLFENF